MVRQVDAGCRDIDLRVGGAWRFVVRQPAGKEIGQLGVYQEIDRPHRIVNTESWEDWDAGETLVTTVLFEHDRRTTFQCTILFPSKEVRDTVVKAGLEHGASEVTTSSRVWQEHNKLLDSTARLPVATGVLTSNQQAGTPALPARAFPARLRPDHRHFNQTTRQASFVRSLATTRALVCNFRGLGFSSHPPEQTRARRATSDTRPNRPPKNQSELVPLVAHRPSPRQPHGSKKQSAIPSVAQADCRTG